MIAFAVVLAIVFAFSHRAHKYENDWRREMVQWAMLAFTAGLEKAHEEAAFARVNADECLRQARRCYLVATPYRFVADRIRIWRAS